MNSVVLYGYVGGVYQREKATSISLAVKSKENTEWFNVVVFGKLKQFVDESLQKGSRIIVNGRLSSYKDSNGRTNTNVIANILTVTHWANGDSNGAANVHEDADDTEELEEDQDWVF